MVKIQEFSDTQKDHIIELMKIKKEQSGFDSDAKFAVSIGLNKGSYSALSKNKYYNGKGQNLLGASKWISLARMVGFQVGDKQAWNHADTQVSITIWTQLEVCQQQSTTGIFCDIAGIGKTHTAKRYAEMIPNAFYINCGKAPKKNSFITELGRVLGFERRGSYEDLLCDCMYYLKTLSNPILIFDEAGDLEQSAILIQKRLYNELEFEVGLYMLGAEGLKKRMNTGVRLRKNGYEEVFSRYGGKYSSIFLADEKDPKKRMTLMDQEIKTLIEAQQITDKQIIREIGVASKGFDLRRVRKEVMKHQMQQAS